MIDADNARVEFKRIFPFTEVCTYHIARYRTKYNKEIALERNRTTAYYVWVQRYDVEIPGVSIKNEKYPGRPYESNQSRNSNLNEKNTPKLKKGNTAWYLIVEDLEALKRLISWYDSLC